MKKLLSLFSTGFLTTCITSVVACDTDAVDIFFRNPAVNSKAIEQIKAIDFNEVSTLKDFDQKVVDILEQAVIDNDINHIVSGSISIEDYFYFYSDNRSDRSVITDLDADNDEIIDFSYINYVIKVNYEERDTFETDFEDDLLYIYNTPITKTNDAFFNGIENVVRRPLRVEFERRETEAQIYNQVIEDFSENLAKYVTSNENMVGFVGGFFNDIDLELAITDVTNASSIDTSKTYEANITSGAGITITDPIKFEIKFYRD